MLHLTDVKIKAAESGCTIGQKFIVCGWCKLTWPHSCHHRPVSCDFSQRPCLRRPRPTIRYTVVLQKDFEVLTDSVLCLIGILVFAILIRRETPSDSEVKVCLLCQSNICMLYPPVVRQLDTARLWRSRATIRLSPTIPLVTGNRWDGPRTTRVLWCHWSTPLVSLSNQPWCNPLWLTGLKAPTN